MPSRITSETLHARLERDAPPVLVEALGAAFYADAHLPGAINIPAGQVESLAPALLPDRSAEIVVYCSGSGSTAFSFAQRLEQLGYTAVAVYDGGKEEWVEHGLPLERLDIEELDVPVTATRQEQP